MKTLLTSLFALLTTLSFSQAPINYTATDCNGNIKTLHTVLGTSNKAVIVLNKGVDCSICVSSAPGWQTWTAQNSSKVEVWGAITYKYNPANFNPPCTATQNWINTHGWSSIFTFPDNNRDWLGAGMPRYYVYSPQDSSLIYEGPSSSTARSMALQASTVGINENQLLDNLIITIQSGSLFIHNADREIQEISLYNIKGQEISSAERNTNQWVMNFNSSKTGIYLLVLKTSSGLLSKKVFLSGN